MAERHSASATTQRARASSSWAPKPRAARRRKFAGARVLAELGHGDAAQGERRRVVAQGNALEGAERVAGGECARRGGDQGVHDERLHRCACNGRPQLPAQSRRRHRRIPKRFQLIVQKRDRQGSPAISSEVV
jgi:hypothetical protein